MTRESLSGLASAWHDIERTSREQAADQFGKP
jgi:hypothetical protein